MNNLPRLNFAQSNPLLSVEVQNQMYFANRSTTRSLTITRLSYANELDRFLSRLMGSYPQLETIKLEAPLSFLPECLRNNEVLRDYDYLGSPLREPMWLVGALAPYGLEHIVLELTITGE